MQKILTWVSILAVVVVGGKALLERTFLEGELNGARERVRGVLDGLKSGGDRQKAIGLWYSGALNPPTNAEAFGRAADGFDRWCRTNSLGSVASYEVGEAVLVSETTPQEPAIVVVSGSIDGRPFKMRVQKEFPIAWVD